MLARRERRWVRLSRRCGALRVAAGGSAPPLPAAALHGLGVVRPGRENGPPTEPENGFPTGQEADISCASKGGHLYASPTAAAFVVAKSEFLLEVLVITLDPPAPLGLPDEVGARGVGRQGGKPILGRFGLVLRPFDQAPRLGTRFATAGIALSRTDPHGGEAGRQFGVAALTPGDAPKGFGRQSESQVLGRNRLMVVVVSQTCGTATTSAPRLGGQRLLARRPQRGRRLDGDDIVQTKLSDAVTELGVDAIAGIRQHDCTRHTRQQSG